MHSHPPPTCIPAEIDTTKTSVPYRVVTPPPGDGWFPVFKDDGFVWCRVAVKSMQEDQQ